MSRRGRLKEARPPRRDPDRYRCPGPTDVLPTLATCIDIPVANHKCPANVMPSETATAAAAAFSVKATPIPINAASVPTSNHLTNNRWFTTNQMARQTRVGRKRGKQQAVWSRMTGEQDAETDERKPWAATRGLPLWGAMTGTCAEERRCKRSTRPQIDKGQHGLGEKELLNMGTRPQAHGFEGTQASRQQMGRDPRLARGKARGAASGTSGPTLGPEISHMPVSANAGHLGIPRAVSKCTPQSHMSASPTDRRASSWRALERGSRSQIVARAFPGHVRRIFEQ